jgi:hypothetical protein
MFRKSSPSQTGLTFVNKITENDEVNFFSYNHIYHGAGIGVGDVDNDQFPDLFLAGNQVDDKLFINRGGMHFEDVTKEAGLSSNSGWSTGVSMIDINADGWLDIYVCRGGPLEVDSLRANQLFINNKDGSFSEKASDYGVGDRGHSSQAYFFDFDKDNDLDLLVLNHHPQFISPYDDLSNADNLAPQYSDQLYRNEGNRTFTNITKKAGIDAGSLGMAASIGDINGDGWVDIYFSGNPLSFCMAYINQGNGTFSKSFNEMNRGSVTIALGSDMADLNNDGLRDIVVNQLKIDETANKRSILQDSDNNGHFDLISAKRDYTIGMHEMHLNRGNGYFSCISTMAGVYVDKFSWAPLVADFDLDGWKDLFVTNGITRDYTDKDFNQTLGDSHGNGGPLHIRQKIKNMPPRGHSNSIYRNMQDLTFTSRELEWGIQTPDYSNGAVYADLDMDGDLDIVTNSMNDTVAVWENDASSSRLFWIEVTINGPEQNIQGVGTRVKVKSGDREQVREYYPNRGLMSSMATPLFFGMGSDRGPYTIEIMWPDGKVSLMDDVRPRDRVMINYLGSRGAEPEKLSVLDKTFIEIAPSFLGMEYVHEENNYKSPQVNGPHSGLHAALGPAMAKADVNGDGLEDIYLGGAAGQSGVLFIQNNNGKFERSLSNPWNRDAASEDVGAIFFDADGDGWLDLYVASGGIGYPALSSEYQDRLYLNKKGVFTRAISALPSFYSSTMAIAVADIDADGDKDLFVGGRIMPGEYPISPESHLLRNDGGVFIEITPEILRKPGMVSDAQFTDYDRDGDKDLVILGENMGIHFYSNEKGSFSEDKGLTSWKQNSGHWMSLHVMDVNNDGNEDLLLGNCGLNQMCMEVQRTYSHSGENHDSTQVQNVDELGHVLLINEGSGYRLEKLPNDAQISPLFRAIPIDLEEDGIIEIIGSGNYYRLDEGSGSCKKGMAFVLRNVDGNWISISPQKSGLYAEGAIRNLCILRTSDKVEWLILAQNKGPLKIFKIQKSLNSI